MTDEQQLVPGPATEGGNRTGSFLSAHSHQFGISQIVTWFKQGWVLYKKAPIGLLACMLIQFICVLPFQFVPYISWPLSAAMQSVFAAGTLSYAHRLASGEQSRIGNIFDGFRYQRSRLLTLGLFSAVLHAVILLTFFLVLSVVYDADSANHFAHLILAGTSPAQIAAIRNDPHMVGMLLLCMPFMLIYCIVMMGLWSANALTFFNQMSPERALIAGLRGSLKNWLPLLVLMLTTIVLSVLISLLIAVPSTMLFVTTHSTFARVLIVAVAGPLLLIFFAGFIGLSLAISYSWVRDLHGREGSPTLEA